MQIFHKEVEFLSSSSCINQRYVFSLSVVAVLYFSLQQQLLTFWTDEGLQFYVFKEMCGVSIVLIHADHDRIH